jgi:hypothetical protein
VNKHFATVAAVGLATALCACSTKPPKQAGDENTFTQPSTGTTSGGSDGSSSPPPEAQGGLNEEQKAQMSIALKRGGEKAAKCAEVVPDSAKGEGEVKVTFDGQKGRVTDASVGPPFAGTPVEACIKRSFVGEIVLPFEGAPLEVPYTVTLADKKAPAAPDKKKK